jgi:cobalt-zinc-cadmium efflux system outer membrane protein
VTLQGVLQEALEKNPELAALRDQVAVARQRPVQERGLAPPIAEVQIWQWPINSFNPADTNMYMFMVGQELPGRGKRDARAAVAGKDIALADADVTIRSWQIVNEIKQAYTALFIARKSTEVHLASVDVLSEIADAARSKYASGRGSQQDALKPVVELSKLHNDVIMHDEEAGLATARLNVLLNRAPETPIGPLQEPRDAALLPASAELQRLAIDHQPELQRARLEVEKAEAMVASARLDRKPDFSVQGGYMLLPGQTDGVLAKVGITWPNAPWSRGRIDARIAEHSANVVSAKSRERALENMLRLAVHEAYVRATAAQERALLLRNTILPQSRQAFDVSQAAYQSDRGNFQAILDSERMLLDSQLDYFKTLAGFAQAVADLERAVGMELSAGTFGPVPPSEGR